MPFPSNLDSGEQMSCTAIYITQAYQAFLGILFPYCVNMPAISRRMHLAISRTEHDNCSSVVNKLNSSMRSSIFSVFHSLLTYALAEIKTGNLLK
ncbi:hypothetical protein X975_00272, partial [Stegodyphus mimosarum]